MKTATFVCENCGKQFEVSTHTERIRKTCSRECWKMLLKRPRNGSREVACELCGKTFREYDSNVFQKRKNGRIYNRRYCSRECRAKAFRGANNPMFVGQTKNRAGYIVIRGELVPEDYKPMIRRGDAVLEHRLVMAQHLGRCLTDSEIVHHLNGVKDDNRIENLELHSQLSHQAVTIAEHRKIAELERRIKELEAQILKGG